MAGLLQRGFQRVEDFGPHAQGLAEAVRAHRHHHEFLEIDGVIGMRTTIDDVHHRHRQGAGRGAADIAVKRQAGSISGGLGDGQRNPQNGIGAELCLVGRAVQLDHRLIDGDLVLGLHAGQRIKDIAVDGRHRLGDALAHVTGLVAIAQFHRLMGAGRGAGGYRRASHRTVFQHHVNLHRRIAAAVQDFAGGDVDDGGHGEAP